MYLFNFGEDSVISNKENDETIINLLSKLTPEYKYLAVKIVKTLAESSFCKAEA